MEQTSIVNEGMDRVSSVFRTLDGELRRVQKQLQTRRKSFEKQLTSGRKDIEKQTRKQVKRLQTELRKSPLVKRAQNLRGEATQQIDSAVDRVLGALQIATKNDLDRIDRKLTVLTRKLKELDRGGRRSTSNGESASL
jgi:LPS O-antigen subunit length determinant protein (WzzB/FepE family)